MQRQTCLRYVWSVVYGLVVVAGVSAYGGSLWSRDGDVVSRAIDAAPKTAARTQSRAHGVHTVPVLSPPINTNVLSARP